MEPPADLATIVLAAGAGSRFGGAKQLALVEGQPALLRTLAAVEGSSDRRIVVLGAHADLIRPHLRGTFWQVVDAADWEAGRGASLRAGLAAAGEADAAMIVLADLPWLHPKAVEKVIAAAAAASEREAFRAFEGTTPGHPLLIRGAALAAARRSPDMGPRELLSSTTVVRVDCSGLGVARDLDTRSDLR
jgi:CTP:molybdopterin cytidylyltransferase MocA